jgi:threonine/homoserine/homoserine lactone efflux protein
MIPSHSSLLLFVSAALVLLAIPGPAVLYVTSRSIGLGRSAGLVSALGIGVGTLVHVAAAAVGLSALLMSSAAAFSVVKYLGAAYLIYLGVQKLRREESLDLFAGMGVMSDSLWAFSAGTVARRLNRNTRWLRTQRYVSGGMLISLGVATAFAGSGAKK